MGPFDFPTSIVDKAARARAVAQAKANGVRLPTFAELAEPWTAPKSATEGLAGVDPDAADARNLYRVNWYNDLSRKGRAAVPVHIELPRPSPACLPASWWYWARSSR